MYFSVRYGRVHAWNSYTCLSLSRLVPEDLDWLSTTVYSQNLLELHWWLLNNLRSFLFPDTQFGVTDSAINHVANIIPIQESLRWDVTDLNKIESKCPLIFYQDVTINML